MCEAPFLPPSTLRRRPAPASAGFPSLPSFVDIDVDGQRQRQLGFLPSLPLSTLLSTASASVPIVLHLYIPPSSCHAPGVATGLILGHVLRVYQLCSHQHDRDEELKKFHDRLTTRGYPSSTILPLLHKAEENARRHIQSRSDETTTPPLPTTRQNQNQIFFHIPYHTANPPSSTIQHLWRQHVAHPLDQEPLHALTNTGGNWIPISKLTVAYSRSGNLGNLLSY